jgi:GNAT superfamily N-acetyltransferase
MEELALRLERHWLACMASLGGGGQVTRLPGALALVHADLHGGLFNFLLLTGHKGVVVELEATLAMGSAMLAEHGRAPLLYLGPGAGDLSLLCARLGALGWRRIHRQAVLYTPLPHPVPPVAPPPASASAIGEESLATWERLLVEAYEVQPQAGQAIVDGWSALLRRPGEGAVARFYLGSLDGRPVGTGLTWSQGSISGLYCGAVRPFDRKRGVARALLCERLADAAAKGDHLAFLQTEEGSPVAHLCLDHLGFYLAYHREVWVPQGGER